METYQVGHLWAVGATAFFAATVLTWLAMSIRWEVDRDRILHESGEKIIQADTRRLKAEDKLKEHRQKVRLVQESLEAINGPKIEHSVTYTV